MVPSDLKPRRRNKELRLAWFQHQLLQQQSHKYFEERYCSKLWGFQFIESAKRVLVELEEHDLVISEFNCGKIKYRVNHNNLHPFLKIKYHKPHRVKMNKFILINYLRGQHDQIKEIPET